jgi:hypothetical protein
VIVEWMLFSFVTGCALTIAATAIDNIALHTRRPRRFIWFTALILTGCWPAIALIRGALLRFQNSQNSEPLSTVAAHPLPGFIVSTPRWDVARAWSIFMLAAWGLLSLVLLARVVLAVRQIKRQQKEWRVIEIDGTKVHVTKHVGPALIGLRAMHIALPEWVLGTEPPLRELILRHESEHRVARDPYLLFTGTVMTALIPWNLPLWFQMRRLRLAIELDCDARVLNVYPEWERYALLLLAIAERRTRARHMLASALTEFPSNLERRITAMRAVPQLSRFRAMCLSLAATTAFVIACAVDKPQSPDSPRRAVVSVKPAKYVDAAAPLFEFQVEKPASLRETSPLHYPPSMKGSGIGGELLAQYVVDETGQVNMQTFKTLKSPGPAFTAVVKTALRTSQYDPAVVGGKAVKSLVEQAFIF